MLLFFQNKYDSKSAEIFTKRKCIEIKNKIIVFEEAFGNIVKYHAFYLFRSK